MKEFHQLIAAYRRMISICYDALSPTATPKQKVEARMMCKDFLESIKPKTESDSKPE